MRGIRYKAVENRNQQRNSQTKKEKLKREEVIFHMKTIEKRIKNQKS